MSIHSKLILICLPILLWGQLACGAEVSPTPGADPDGVRPAFVAALQRVRLHQPDLPDSPALKSYVIYDYLVAARLKRDLQQKPDENLDASIDAFLQSRFGRPVTRGLRRDWLASLADRHRWDLFLARSIDVTDPLIQCDRLEGRLATGDTEGLGTAALARWSMPQKQPAECNAVFVWLRQQGLVTPVLAESSARAALAADNPRLAREFAADVPVARSAALLQWSDLLEAPRPTLTVLANHPALAVEPDALVAGFDKFSHIDSAGAQSLLPQLLARTDVSPALRARLQRAAALGAAYDKDPRAIAAFDNLEIDALDTLAEEWRVRAALWFGDYGRVRNWIELMPASLATQPRWRYWHARAVEATPRQAQKRPPLYMPRLPICGIISAISRRTGCTADID